VHRRLLCKNVCKCEMTAEWEGRIGEILKAVVLKIAFEKNYGK